VDVSINTEPPLQVLGMTASTAFLGTLDCTRNLLDYELPKSLNVNQLETVERLVTTVLLSDDVARALYPNASEDDLAEGCGVYYTMNEVLEDPSEARVVLASNGLLIPLWNIPESDRLHGKHWPYGRGVFISNGSNLAVWINVLDHIRIVTCTPHTKPGNVGLIYSRVARLVSVLQKHLEFNRDPRLGYLCARPTVVGNTLQFSFTLRFPYLIKEPDNLRHLCLVRGLSYYRKSNTADVVRIGNQQCLGVSELQTFEDFSTAAVNILQLEKDLAVSNSLHIAAAFVNIFKRKKQSLASME
jgi:arginine kinase